MLFPQLLSHTVGVQTGVCVCVWRVCVCVCVYGNDGDHVGGRVIYVAYSFSCLFVGMIGLARQHVEVLQDQMNLRLRGGAPALGEVTICTTFSTHTLC